MMQRLSPTHQQMLVEESGIALEVIAERGYYTATTVAQLEALDFAEYQRRVPALVLPSGWALARRFARCIGVVAYRAVFVVTAHLPDA